MAAGRSLVSFEDLDHRTPATVVVEEMNLLERR
jgi:hypothetical protein